MIISHQHRFVFVKTRKTAGTSVEIALARHAGPEDVLTTFALAEDNEARRRSGADAQNQAVPLSRYGLPEWRQLLLRRKRTSYRSHLAATHIRRLMGRRSWDDYFTFTVVRNPWETAASAYFWLTRDAPDRPSFRSFLESGSSNWRNWRLYTDNDRIIVDEVVRYEELEPGLAAVTERLGLPRLELPQAKGGLRRGPYQELYGAAERDLVARACREEIEHFGYVF